MNEENLPPSVPRERSPAERRLGKNDYAKIMVQQVENLHQELVKNGRNDLVLVGKLDDNPQTHPVTLMHQMGCMFIDFVPSSEEDVSHPAELLRKPHSMLFDQDGDSSFMERNIPVRIALRNLGGNLAYTLETWTKVDTEKAIKLADLVQQGVPGALASYLQINTRGKSEAVLTEQLHTALEFIVPNIFKEARDITPTQQVGPYIPRLSDDELKERVSSITDMYTKSKQ